MKAVMDGECRMCAGKRTERLVVERERRPKVCPDVGERLTLKLTVKGVL